jgi:hypothetical protein
MARFKLPTTKKEIEEGVVIDCKKCGDRKLGEMHATHVPGCYRYCLQH